MTEQRRKWARDWSRRKYERVLAHRRRGLGTCPRRFGRFGVCGGVLETQVLRGGGTVTTCPRCERFKAGTCVDCPQPVAGQVRKARRCAGCTRAAQRGHLWKYRTNNRTLVNRRAKLYGRKKSWERADYKRLWRAANPEKVKAQKRRYALRQPQTAYDYHRKYRENHQPHFEESRWCLGGCGRTAAGRVKKCAECKAAIRASALRMLQRRAA